MEADRPRVLVVDDDTALASTIADGLVERNYDAVTASTSASATALVRDRSFDIVVTDLRMPDVDGVALLELSRAIAPERPVIVMTAFGAVDSAVETLRKGAYHYLLKPFKVAELDIFIRRALERTRTTDRGDDPSSCAARALFRRRIHRRERRDARAP